MSEQKVVIHHVVYFTLFPILSLPFGFILLILDEQVDKYIILANGIWFHTDLWMLQITWIKYMYRDIYTDA